MSHQTEVVRVYYPDYYSTFDRDAWLRLSKYFVSTCPNMRSLYMECWFSHKKLSTIELANLIHETVQAVRDYIYPELMQMATSKMDVKFEIYSWGSWLDDDEIQVGDYIARCPFCQ